MKKKSASSWLTALLAVAFIISPLAPTAQAEESEEESIKNLLVVTVTKGFRHGSIPTAERVLGEIAERSGEFTVDYVRDDEEMAEKMTVEALQNYDGVFFANTTGDLPIPDREAFLLWIRSGKGFMGAHSATDTYHNFPPFTDMIGGRFQTHGPQLEVNVIVEDPHHPATCHYSSSFDIYDEIYILRDFHRDRVHGLLTLNQQPQPNNRKPGDYPIAWTKNYSEGRVFYTSLGHRDDVWESEDYQKHLIGGIRWALGLVEADAAVQDNTFYVTPEEHVEGFRPLFDGVSTDGWRLRSSDRESWSAQNGMLVNDPEGLERGSDIITEEDFEDFTIRLEYMIPEGSNSGLYLRGRKEIQILDDYATGEPTPHGNGGIYNHTPVSEFASRPPGEWQELEATIVGNRISASLNGVKIHEDVEVDRATGGQLDNNVGESGPIMIQGDHGGIAVRNVRIKSIE
ncbi:MAG: ThuA domain-containing protein [Opitutales bacterium]